MKAVPAKKVRMALWRLGLKPQTRSNGTGHEVWGDELGRSCRPMLRKKDVPYPAVYSLGMELESKGVCSRQEFLSAIRAEEMSSSVGVFGLQREIISEGKVGGVTMEQLAEKRDQDKRLPVLTLEERWVWCEMIYEGVKNVKEIEERVIELELRLEEARNQEQQARAKTLEYLDQLGVRQRLEETEKAAA